MRVVVAGAAGFVGDHLVPALTAAGHEVACGSRSPDRAALARPEHTWVDLDVDRRDSLDRALEGADALVFLVHRMKAGGDVHHTEEACAERALRACEAAGVRRVVYLGAPRPHGAPSPHLAARLRTGDVLRSGAVSTVELRAAMIIGAGSASWLIVRDLALRLPAMVLPSWLQTRSQPIGVDDVVAALVHAVSDPLRGSEAFDLPGPEILTAQQILERIAAQRGMRPVAVRVPLLTPGLSSHWIRLVSRADFDIARQLVDGLTHDLVSADDGYWLRMPTHPRVPFDEAVRRALATEPALPWLGRTWEATARRVARPARGPSHGRSGGSSRRHHHARRRSRVR